MWVIVNDMCWDYPNLSLYKMPSSVLGAGISTPRTHLTLAAEMLPIKQVTFPNASSPVLT